MRIIIQEFGFFHAAQVISPCIVHLCQATVIGANPAVKNAGDNFQQEQAD